MSPAEISILQCPVTGNTLAEVQPEEFSRFGIDEELHRYGQLTLGLVDASHTYFYPVFNGIYILLPQYALFIGKNTDIRTAMRFDKKRVFAYYNEVNFQTIGALETFADAGKWVDFREVSAGYKHHALAKAAQFYKHNGTYLLDIASGPVGFPENQAMSDGFKYHVCVDISINVLLKAKQNLAFCNKAGIFICGDITNIPLQDDVCDAVISQHTLYHVHKNEQQRAVNELYRVAKYDSKIVIIYSWFYHSWFMNLSLNVVQLYRMARHFAGKAYVRLFPQKPRLYFYAHSPRWFKKSFAYSNSIEFHSWQSVNKYFLDIFIHAKLGGKTILKWLMKLENRYSHFMGRFGEYAAIVITKEPKK